MADETLDRRIDDEHPRLGLIRRGEVSLALPLPAQSSISTQGAKRRR